MGCIGVGGRSYEALYGRLISDVELWVKYRELSYLPVPGYYLLLMIKEGIYKG
jgi:hypothetical protein